MTVGAGQDDGLAFLSGASVDRVLLNPPVQSDSTMLEPVESPSSLTFLNSPHFARQKVHISPVGGGAYAM